MRLNLKLTQKGLMLVAIPLVFELVFVAVLAHMLDRAEQQAAQAAYFKTVTSETNGLITLLYEGASSLLTYHNAKHDEAIKLRCQQIIDEVPTKFKNLKGLVASDPHQSLALTTMEPDLKRVLVFMQKLKQSMDSSQQVQLFEFLSDWPANVREPFVNLMTNLRSLVDYQRSELQAWPEAEARTREAVKVVLIMFVFINIILALLLAKVVTSEITRRVETLMENTKRLSSGEDLKPSQEGSDEIAHLDRYFHMMATDLKQASDKERAILEMVKASEAKVRAIIESMLVGLVIVDEHGTIESVNPTTEHLFLYSQAELEGQSLTKLFPDLAKASESSFMDALKTSALHRVAEYKARKSNGDVFPVEATLSELSAADGNKLLLNLLDVTERQEVQRMKQQFVAMVSHELRTPLTSIQGFFTLMSMGMLGTLNEQGERKVALADRNVTRLIELINDLLDIEKMEAGHFQMQFGSAQLSHVVDRAVDSVRGFAEKHSVSLECNTGEVTVEADEKRLVQVLINLLSNAIKFSPEGERVTVEGEETGGRLKVSVIDRGPGIPQKHREAVFEKFHQVDAKQSRKVGGTGLGLAICKAIIAEHHGEIGVDSEEGQGSKFWFSIPLEQDGQE